MRRRRSVLAIALVLAALGSRGPRTARAAHTVPLTDPARLCVGASIDPVPCRPARDVERWLEADHLSILSRRDTVGAQGAAVLRLRADDAVFDAKWRAASSATDDNDPIGELGAHRVQTLVLAPRDYVVPPAASHCFRAPDYVPSFGADLPIDEMKCVLGFLSFWLSGTVGLGEARRDHVVPWDGGDVWSADPALYGRERFAHGDAARRRNVAHLNLIAFLVHNGDAHTAQFVVDPRRAHVFLVDHSVAFSAPVRPSMRGRQNFAELVVPAIPADTAARIEKLEEDDVMSLMRIEEHRLVDGVWRHARPGPLIDDGRAHVRREADRIQVGLTRRDALGVLERVRTLQAALRDGTLDTFE